MNLPTFTPESLDAADGKVQITGEVSAQVYQGQNWIKEGWIGYIGRGGEPPIKGRWFQEDERWRFVSESRKASKFKVGEPLPYYDGYWGDRACIVLAPMTWTEAQFEARERWDHDHCGICWAKIDTESPRHFESSERDVICPDCYDRYVQLRSLAFIEPRQDQRMEK